MKPYIEVDGERLYLPQEVDPHRFEVCMHTLNGTVPFFLLCPVVKHRYHQATGIVLERVGKELQLHLAGGSVVRRTFPLAGLETKKISIDWNAGASPSFTNKETQEEPQ
jgi:hypothetical protein